MNIETYNVILKTNVQILLDRLAKDEKFDHYGHTVKIVAYEKQIRRGLGWDKGRYFVIHTFKVDNGDTITFRIWE
jgi:hypothetical protein